MVVNTKYNEHINFDAIIYRLTVYLEKRCCKSRHSNVFIRPSSYLRNAQLLRNTVYWIRPKITFDVPSFSRRWANLYENSIWKRCLANVRNAITVNFIGNAWFGCTINIVSKRSEMPSFEIFYPRLSTRKGKMRVGETFGTMKLQ